MGDAHEISTICNRGLELQNNKFIYGYSVIQSCLVQHVHCYIYTFQHYFHITKTCYIFRRIVTVFNELSSLLSLELFC